MVVKTFQQARHQLTLFKPKKKWYRRWVKRSAIALILRQTEAGLEALMIKRADREGDPWSGHMAFPGGRGDPADNNNLQTARRETWEEIGLDTDQYATYLGRLSDVATFSLINPLHMVITPYVFMVEQVPELNLNHEVAEVVWIPLSFIANKDNRQSMQWQFRNRVRNLPCYFFQQRRIWGLSLLMLDELVGVFR
ncbi:CoA pyrophosphatase [uncultured Oceanicoccus sp.]|uniref:NUDIX hydrolase n=1 Tax=uncultured Oceanicoccus sp. TaxID=1706381 RepID=UPI0030D8E5A0